LHPNPLHITYFHYLFGNDTALHHVEQFADAARRLGHHVSAHALNLGTPPRTAGDASAAPPTLKQRLKPRLSRFLHEPKELYWNLRYYGREHAILARERPDVLVARDNHWSVSYLLAAHRLGIPVVVEVNSPAAEMRMYRGEHLHLPLVADRLERWRVRNADALTAVSTPLKDTLVAAAGIAADKISVVSNGVDVERFTPQVTPDEQIARHFRGAAVVGFVGSFQAFHKPEALGRMAVLLSQRRPDVGFAFVGGGAGMEVVRQITQPIGERTLFLDRVPHARVPSIVRAIDIGVLPETAYYCCPLKILEWMAAGIAVVAPGYAAIRELIEDGENGALFAPGDVAALVETVDDLLGRPERRRQLGASAAKRVRGSLTWRHNAERVIETCRAAIARRSAGTPR
jgi:glycosyltransferase involved in cell wall biosynthesis